MSFAIELVELQHVALLSPQRCLMPPRDTEPVIITHHELVSVMKLIIRTFSHTGEKRKEKAIKSILFQE